MSEDAKLPGLSPDELDTLKKVFSSPLDIPNEWKAWLVSYLEANPPVVPLSQIFGYKVNAFAKRVSAGAYVAGPAAGAGYGDPADGLGPILTDLPDGMYAIFFGASIAGSSSANPSWISASFNGAAAVDADGTPGWQGNVPENMTTGLLKQLVNDNKNTVKVKYKQTEGANSMSVNYRWIIAIRIA